MERAHVKYISGRALRRDKMNKEGYRDPTAEKAIHNADKMPKYIQSIFDKLNLAAGKSGVEVLVIRDKETGRKYRR